jgi:2-dehydro-3-deoxyglucarate aldolase
MGQAGYDWVAVDLEHGSTGTHQLPDLFRAIELGNTLPIARLAEGTAKECKQVLDAGGAGVIVPMISSAEQLSSVRDACRWPPSGNRGIGFSRANLYGKFFEDYKKEAQAPLLIAMIENTNALDELGAILAVEGLDAVLIGPYDLSGSLGITGQFDNTVFIKSVDSILAECKKRNVAAGIHVVEPSKVSLQAKISEGYRFIAYSIDAVLLLSAAQHA